MKVQAPIYREPIYGYQFTKEEALTGIERWTARFTAALARNPKTASLKPMINVIGNFSAHAFARGATLDEVAEAAGLR